MRLVFANDCGLFGRVVEGWLFFWRGQFKYFRDARENEKQTQFCFINVAKISEMSRAGG